DDRRPDARLRGARLLARRDVGNEALADARRTPGRHDRRLRQFLPVRAPAAGRGDATGPNAGRRCATHERPPAAMTGRYVAYALLLAAAAAVTAQGAGDRIPATARFAFFLGLGLGAAGAISWILLTSWSIGRGHQAFMAASVLGILGRLVIYSATLIYVALRTSIDLLWFAGALLGF